MQLIRGFSHKSAKIEQKTSNRYLRQLLATASLVVWVKLSHFAQRPASTRKPRSSYCRDFPCLFVIASST